MGWAVRTEFRNASQFPLTVELMDRIWAFVEPLLADICAHLHMQSLPKRKNLWNIQYYGEGSYGRRHKDDVNGTYRVSMLYYFCSPQRAFTGGSFLLCDKHASNGSAIPNRFTGIPFADNVLVAFPSEQSHEATNIHCLKKGIRYGRLAVLIHLG